MASYESYARFYDSTQGDRADDAAYVRGLIERHHPAARTVLELACGTGSILQGLQSDFEVTGVDLSPAMLEVAAGKVPGARLVHADMTEVSLGETFDVVLCLYDSINHLLRFEEWESLFDRAREHLFTGGILVFDVNTEFRLRELVAQRELTSWFGDGNLLLIDVCERAGGGVDWHLRVFERRGGSTYRLHSERIPETAFPVEQIRAGLERRFRRVRVYDAQRARPAKTSRRLHFVSRA